MQTRTTPTMTQVYTNDDFQLTGISVSKTGRLFVNFPRWSDRYVNAVIEVLPDGSEKPFPNEEWNRWNLKPATVGDHFVCVQSVVVDAADHLWVLDPAAPLLTATIPGGPKLVEIDLATNKVVRTIVVDPTVALPDTYLNDVRFDLERKVAYITDSGHGGIIVVDLANGTAHRALDGHPSVLVEEGVKVVVDGKELQVNGKPPQFQSDGIALSPDGAYLYYKPVTANGLYRIATEALRNAKTSPDAAAAAVEKVADAFPTDGLWMNAKGDLYLTDVTHDALTRMTPDGRFERVVEDSALQWPDTLSEGPDGAIYVSTSQINNAPTFNQGKSTRTSPYAVYKVDVS
jgi:sugar lactone lactonase YvrE